MAATPKSPCSKGKNMLSTPDELTRKLQVHFKQPSRIACQRRESKQNVLRQT